MGEKEKWAYPSVDSYNNTKGDMPMDESTAEPIMFAREETREVLEEIARRGAQRMLQVALEEEVAEFVERHGGVRDAEG